jgi:hypothetical protein
VGDPFNVSGALLESPADADLTVHTHDLWPVQNDLDAQSDSTYQTLHLVRQQDGRVFLLATMNTLNYSPALVGKDIAVLYRLGSTTTWWANGVTVPAFAEGDRVTVTAAMGLHQHCSFEDQLAGQRRLYANFNAAAGFHVAANGELLLYGASHNARGPMDSDGWRTGQMIEFRSVDVREVLPPDAATNPDFAWVELWNGARGWDRATGREPSLLIEYADRAEDDWFEFDALTAGWPNPERYGDQADGVRWFAPVGMVIALWEHDYAGGGVVVLTGTGRVESIADLRDVNFRDTSDSAHDEISAVSFHRMP